jgi:ABC-2 type transport system permease protein
MNNSAAFFFAYLKVDLLNFVRNKTAAFWTFAFPLLLLIIFMGSFGGSSGLGKVAIRVDDQDKSAVSQAFVDHVRFVFKSQKSIDVVFDKDADETLILRIPNGFKQRLEARQGVVLQLDRQAAPGMAAEIAEKILSSVADDFVLRQLYEYRGISVVSDLQKTKRTVNSNDNYAAYLVTGLLCMVVISTSLMGFVIPLVSSRQNGHFRIFELIPASKIAVVMALAISKFIVILGSGVLLFVFAALAYKLGLPAELTRYSNGFLVLMIGVLGFLALALVVAARVTSSDWANIICNLIYFPLILLGNLFIPIEGSGSLSKFLDHMPVNLFVQALRGTIMGGEPLTAFANFFLLFGILIGFSLIYVSRAFVLNRGVR